MSRSSKTCLETLYTNFSSSKEEGRGGGMEKYFSRSVFVWGGYEANMKQRLATQTQVVG